MASGSACRIVIVGSGGCGKSSLCIQFIHKKFLETYDPTLENAYRKQVTVDDKEVVLDLIDTAGQDDFAAIRESYYSDGEGFVICYDITARPSFEEARTLHKDITTSKQAPFPCVIVGNKKDLEERRDITTTEGDELQKQVEADLFLETSAKLGENVDTTFLSIARLVLQFRNGLWRGVTPPETKKDDKKDKGKRRTCTLY